MQSVYHTEFTVHQLRYLWSVSANPWVYVLRFYVNCHSINRNIFKTFDLWARPWITMVHSVCFQLRIHKFPLLTHQFSTWRTIANHILGPFSYLNCVLFSGTAVRINSPLRMLKSPSSDTAPLWGLGWFWAVLLSACWWSRPRESQISWSPDWQRNCSRSSYRLNALRRAPRLERPCENVLAMSFMMYRTSAWRQWVLHCFQNEI